MRSILFLALLAAVAAPVHSQGGGDAVVVTANRFAELRRNLPAGVTMITEEDLRRSASTNLAEILAQFGLLHIRDLTGSANPQVDLRGYGVTGDQNTLILVDGVRLSENEQVAAELTSIPIESIERIEILRGSGAVLYGAGATAGTVNIITRRPRPGETRAYALARAGGYGTRDTRAGYSSQGEVLGVSIAYADEDTQGYRRNNRYQQTNVTGSFEARSGQARGYLRYGFDQQHLRLPGGLTEVQINADRRQTLTPDDYSTRNGGYLVLGGSAVAGRNEFTADLSYRKKHAVASFALFGGFYRDTKADVWAFAPRAKLVFDAFGREHDVVLGLDVERWDYLSASASSLATLDTAPFSRRLGTQDNDALYGQANLRLSERTRLTIGGRVQRSRDRLTEQVFPDDRRGARTLRAGELGLRHHFGAGWSGYGKYGTSFRVANFDDNACFFPPCTAPFLMPQTAKGGEVGVELERDGLRARASLYDTRLNNEIYFSPLAGANINLSPTERRGAEMEAGWQATPTLNLRAALALMQARFRSGTYGGVDVSGKDVPQVPAALLTAGASWNLTGRSRLNANLRHVGRQRYDNDQANIFARLQPGYALADLKLEHRIDRVNLAFEVRNLFDKKYYSWGIWDGANSFTALPAPGRAAFVSAAYRLD